MEFEQIGDDLTHEDAEQIAKTGTNGVLLRAIISLSLYDEDRDYAASYCMRFKEHEDSEVRGAAMIGFGHLSRRFKDFGTPSAAEVGEALKVGLKDPDSGVRGKADDSADEFERFLKIKIR